MKPSAVTTWWSIRIIIMWLWLWSRQNFDINYIRKWRNQWMIDNDNLIRTLSTKFKHVTYSKRMLTWIQRQTVPEAAHGISWHAPWFLPGFQIDPKGVVQDHMAQSAASVQKAWQWLRGLSWSTHVCQACQTPMKSNKFFTEKPVIRGKPKSDGGPWYTSHKVSHDHCYAHTSVPSCRALVKVSHILIITVLSCPVKSVELKYKIIKLRCFASLTNIFFIKPLNRTKWQVNWYKSPGSGVSDEPITHAKIAMNVCKMTAIATVGLDPSKAKSDGRHFAGLPRNGEIAKYISSLLCLSNISSYQITMSQAMTLTPAHLSRYPVASRCQTRQSHCSAQGSKPSAVWRQTQSLPSEAILLGHGSS